jgi:integrase
MTKLEKCNRKREEAELTIRAYLQYEAREASQNMKMQMRQMTKEYVLKDLHPYNIYVDSVKKYYKTYLPLDNEKKRKLITRKTKEDLEEVIFEFWLDKYSYHSVGEVFEDFICTNPQKVADGTLARYKRLFNQCFDGIRDARIEVLDKKEVSLLCGKNIEKYHMDKHAYNNMSSLFRCLMKYANICGYIPDTAVFSLNDILVPRKKLQENKRQKQLEEEIFNQEELSLLLPELKKNPDVENQALLLMVSTGMRPGEVAALKPESLMKNGVKVQEKEVEIIENGLTRHGTKAGAKTPDGIREVMVSEKYQYILRDLEEKSQGQKYVFEKDGKRVESRQLTRRLRNVCKKVGISPKSAGKLRKTYASMACEKNVPLPDLAIQMGHSNITTTNKYYIRSVSTVQQHQYRLKNVI